MERCELTELPADSCGCAWHRASPGFGARHDQGPDAAAAAPPLAVSKDLRLNPAFDGKIHRRDCWHLGGIDGVQKEADWTSYEIVDAAFVRANRHLCCSTCDPGRDA